MTENKRFTLSERDLNEINNTNVIEDEGIPCTQRQIVKLLNELYDEMEHYRKLYLQMSYYFDDDVSSFSDLDHDDFEALKKLAKGEYDE